MIKERCGAMVEDWATKAGGHKGFASDVDSQGPLSNGGRATFVAPYTCPSPVKETEAWDKDRLADESGATPAEDNCYIALFSGKCDATGKTGGVYKITKTWYNSHSGGPVIQERCGVMVEDWATKGFGSHSGFASDVDSQGPLSNGDRATFVAPYTCPSRHRNRRASHADTEASSTADSCDVNTFLRGTCSGFRSLLPVLNLVPYEFCNQHSLWFGRDAATLSRESFKLDDFSSSVSSGAMT